MMMAMTMKDENVGCVIVMEERQIHEQHKTEKGAVRLSLCSLCCIEW